MLYDIVYVCENKKVHSHYIYNIPGNFAGFKFSGGRGGGFEGFTDCRGRRRNFMTVPIGGVGSA